MRWTSFACALVVSLAVGLPTASVAGEFFEKEGAAIRGYDPVAYFVEHRAVKGSPTITIDYKGSRFQFTSVANRDRFREHPEQFAPQYGGYCAFGAAQGYKATTDPNAFTIVEQKLYLNYSVDVQAKWRRDPAGYIKKADQNWPEVERTTKLYE
jgi:hypothetical protein